jgi:hypothetical protein
MPNQQAWQDEHSVQATDFDRNKISMINFEFGQRAVVETITMCNFMLILFVRGMTVSLFTHVAVFKAIFQSYSRLFSNFQKFFQFRDFMQNLERDFPLVRFKLTHNAPQEERGDGDGELGQEREVEQFEDCAICQEHMVTARKLHCGHFFHQFCIIQLIQSGSKNCPMCRSEIRYSSSLNANAQA